MGNFTYQTEKSNSTLETYEWDNVWWDHAGTTGVPRVLYIGDSISCQTRSYAENAADNKIYFDNFGTSKAIDNPYFKDAISMFAVQQVERQVILFNNGLHGWHLDDTTEYAQAYEDMLKYLLKNFNGTPLILLLTTHVADDERDQRVKERNRAVSGLAEKYNLPVIDMYAISKENADTISPDGVHYTPNGYRLFAEAIVNKIRELVLREK